jgi:hypothetical protein
VTISGTDFSPVVADGLTDSPKVLMPRVLLVSDAGEVEVPPAGITTADDTGTALTVVIPMGLVGPTESTGTEATYDVVVENPNGNRGSLAQGITVVPPPLLTAVDPTSGPVGTSVMVTLTGTGFRDGMTVSLDAATPVAGSGVVVTSPTTAMATFDLTNVAPGTYDITVTNVDGCSSTLAGAFTVFVPTYFTLLGVEPPFGCTCDRTTVTILSDAGFVSTPRVELRPAGETGPVTTLERVAFIDANTITAVVPMGLDIGLYDVTVINPPTDGGLAVLADGFRVVANPIPSIEAISPNRGETNASIPVEIYGENFRNPVMVELIDETGTVVFTVPSVAPDSPNLISTTFNTNNVGEGPYLVRVTNLDENTYSTFSNFLVASLGPSGNLHEFAEEPALNTGRRILAGASGRDSDGNRFIYAIGGDTGVGGEVLNSVEVSQLSAFGSLSDWSEVNNPLSTPRTGAAAVAVPVFGASNFVPEKTYLYVLGGQDGDDNIVTSVERAVILSGDDAPRATATASATEGTLEAGTWYYKVSAVLEAGDPDNPGGETLPSDEAIITIGGATGSIELTWDPVEVNGTAAASYRIYRTDAANGVSQTEHLIATDVVGTTYVDTGDAAGTQPPLPPGAHGTWLTVAQTLTQARWGHQATLGTDVDDARFIYAIGGKSDNAAGYLDSVEFAKVNADGTIGAFTTGADANLATPLSEARAFFSLAIETAAEVADFTLGTRFFAVGGMIAGDGTGEVSDTIEFADITTAGGNGGNGAWTTYTGAGTPPKIAGSMAVIRSEKLFVVGGATTGTNTTFTGITPGSSDAPFKDGDLFQPINSTSKSLQTARALGVVVTGAGFLYFVGGTSDGTDALASTERTF